MSVLVHLASWTLFPTMPLWILACLATGGAALTLPAGLEPELSQLPYRQRFVTEMKRYPGWVQYAWPLLLSYTVVLMLFASVPQWATTMALPLYVGSFFWWWRPRETSTRAAPNPMSHRGNAP